MRILFASSEVVPFSKTGGLADVAGALPRALADRGHEVLTVTPWYADLGGESPPLWIGDEPAPFGDGFEPVGVGTLEAGGVRFAFVGHEDFRRERPYGYPDDVRRFARFTRAVPQVAARAGFRPEVVHAHDWHTGYLPVVLKRGWHLPPGWPGLPSVFTIHNVQHQGVSELDATLHALRLPPALRASGIDHFGSANAMQAALDFADHVTTVSPAYAREIQRPPYGFGLDGTLRHVAHKLSGILNGLDTDTWNPATDPHLPARYDAEDPGPKEVCREALAGELGLDGDGPLMGVVSRLADQKGIDVLLEAAPRLVRRGWRLALLGAGDAALEEQARSLAGAHPGRVSATIGYADPLAHRIYAGADAFCVPSRFEPCGLTQMIAMRYGALPVARATGGLRDTIRHGETGFLFDHANGDGLAEAAEQARTAHAEGRAEAMRRTAMRQDFGWDRSAAAYESIYARVTEAGP